MQERKIEIKIVFDESDLNGMLASCYFGDGEPPKVSGLTKTQFRQLKKNIKESCCSVVDEYVKTGKV
jgi:hypothetical protein